MRTEGGQRCARVGSALGWDPGTVFRAPMKLVIVTVRVTTLHDMGMSHVNMQACCDVLRKPVSQVTPPPSVGKKGACRPSPLAVF